MFVIIDLTKTKIVDPTERNKPPPHRDAHRQTHSRPPRYRRTLDMNDGNRKESYMEYLAMSCDTEGRRDRLRQRTTARTLAAQNGGAEEEVSVATKYQTDYIRREESPTRGSSVEGAPDRRLPSGPRPCIYAKFPPSITKLLNLQNTKAKLLDTSFQ